MTVLEQDRRRVVSALHRLDPEEVMIALCQHSPVQAEYEHPFIICRNLYLRQQAGRYTRRPAMDDSWSIHLLPQFRRRGSQVLFMVEPEPVLELATDELGAFDLIAAGAAFGTLRGAGAAALTERLCERGIALPCAPQAPVAGPHLLVIEPHMDDAVLGVGGQLLRRKDRERVTVLSVVRWSDYTKLGPLDRQEVSALRAAESALAARFVGFHHEVMDELDFPLRVREEIGLSPTPGVREAVKRFAPTPAAVAALGHRILARVEQLAPDEVWIPLGVGENPDHVLTSRSCLWMLHQAPAVLRGKPVCLYEDLGPFPLFAGHIERILAVHRRTGALREIEEDVTAVFPDLLRAVSVYASQVDMSPSARPMSGLASMMDAFAAPSRGSSRRIERRYAVVQPPRIPAHGEVVFRPIDLTAATVALAPCVRRRAELRRVVVFNAGSFGDFARGAQVLAATFAAATIEVYATPDYFTEIASSRVDRVTAHQAEERDFGRLRAALPVDCLTIVIDASSAVRSFGDAIMAFSELVPS
jgi:LmbE family N-acetylglucosaminyl deacetylase